MTETKSSHGTDSGRQSSPVVLFANGKSGSNQAKKYLKLHSDSLNLKTNLGKVELTIADLQNPEDREKGIQEIKSLLETFEKFRVVVAGGDGSLIWVIEELLKHQLDISSIEFGILPFGTGNDLAAMLGWGRKPPKKLIGKNLSHLVKYAESWLQAEAKPLDIWQISIEVEETGHFEKITTENGHYRREHLRFESDSDLKVYSRLMTNYFSVGLDARIGVGFDKRRTTSKIFNRMIYCWEGFKKIFCLPNTRVPEITSTFYEDSNCIFNNSSIDKRLPEKTSVFLALNSRTYAGGDNFIWDAASPGEGENTWQEQSPKDGKLEFVIFKGEFDLGLEQIIAGRAQKLLQSQGPFTLNFNELPENRRVYMQIDGEYFYAVKPKRIVINLSEISEKVQVLVKN